jgi:hypothetical protein
VAIHICIERMALRPVACNTPACAHCACIEQLVLELMDMLDERSAGTSQPAVSEVVAARVSCSATCLPAVYKPSQAWMPIERHQVDENGPLEAAEVAASGQQVSK